jgi:hypothetical protein
MLFFRWQGEGMKALKITGIVVGVLLAVFVSVGYMLPSYWEVTRSIEIQAPPEKIYPLISDFKNGWPLWSTFDTSDPDIQYTYSGSETGQGSQRQWTSEKMGNGQQSIVIADPKTGVEFDLDMEGNDFQLKGSISMDPIDNGTKVTWKDYGDTGYNVFYRYMGAMMESMMGKTFEESLVKLKSQAEASGPSSNQ